MPDSTPPAAKRPIALFALIAAFLILVPAAVGIVLWNSGRHDAQSTLADCDVRRGCTLPGGTQIRFTPPQDVTKPFAIRMTGVPDNVRRITVHFTMRNMDLGFNLFDLRNRGGGIWTVDHAVLPLCIDERNDFLADLALDGQHYNIVFTAP